MTRRGSLPLLLLAASARGTLGLHAAVHSTALHAVHAAALRPPRAVSLRSSTAGSGTAGSRPAALAGFAKDRA